MTALSVNWNRNGCGPFCEGACVGFAEMVIMPSTPGLVAVAGTSRRLIAVTVVLTGMVTCSLLLRTVTFAPSSRPTFEPGGRKSVVLEILIPDAGSVTAGNASVPEVPENVAHVVPG